MFEHVDTSYRCQRGRTPHCGSLTTETNKGVLRVPLDLARARFPNSPAAMPKARK